MSFMNELVLDNLPISIDVTLLELLAPLFFFFVERLTLVEKH